VSDRLVIVPELGTVDVWNLATRKVTKIPLHDIKRISWNCSNLLMASAHGVFIVSLDSTLDIIQLASISEEIMTAQWIQNTCYVLIVTNNHQIRVWDSQTNCPIIEYGFQNISACTAFFTYHYVNNRRLAGIEILVSRRNGRVTCFSFIEEDSQWILLNFREFMLETLSRIHLLTVHCGVLFVADWSGRMAILDLKKNIQRLLPITQPSPITSLWLQDEMVHGTYNGSLCYWNKT
jgi:WD40 repeat protein